LLRDCIVSPDVFNSMVDRLRDFVVPYQHALETEANQRNVHLYLVGLLSYLDCKNAEKIAAFVDVERLVIQAFIGTAPWDHRPLIQVLVGQVAARLGEPDGIIAFDPSSFPKRGRHSVGVKRQWCSHRGKVDNCQVGVFMGYVSRYDHTLLDFRLSYGQKTRTLLDKMSLANPRSSTLLLGRERRKRRGPCPGSGYCREPG
jgi:SRSO17 transposase